MTNICVWLYFSLFHSLIRCYYVIFIVLIPLASNFNTNSGENSLHQNIFFLYIWFPYIIILYLKIYSKSCCIMCEEAKISLCSINAANLTHLNWLMMVSVSCHAQRQTLQYYTQAHIRHTCRNKPNSIGFSIFHMDFVEKNENKVTRIRLKHGRICGKILSSSLLLLFFFLHLMNKF